MSVTRPEAERVVAQLGADFATASCVHLSPLDRDLLTQLAMRTARSMATTGALRTWRDLVSPTLRRLHDELHDCSDGWSPAAAAAAAKGPNAERGRVGEIRMIAAVAAEAARDPQRLAALMAWEPWSGGRSDAEVAADLGIDRPQATDEISAAAFAAWTVIGKVDVDEVAVQSYVITEAAYSKPWS